MKVELTQAQADFIESFKRDGYPDNDEKVEIGKEFPSWASTAIYNISRFGYGFPMTDGKSEEVSSSFLNPDHYEEFNHDSKALLISGVINGYTVKKERFVMYLDFTDNTVSRAKRRLYYGSDHHVTDKGTATVFPTFGVSEETLMAEGWRKEVL
jgi:hypothetical protein